MANSIPPQTIDITQGSILSKLIHSGSVYLLSNLLIAFTAFIMLPINTRLFTQDEYGKITTIDSISDLLLVLVSVNIIQAYIRYYHEYKFKSDDLSLFTSTIYWSILVWGIFVVVVSIIIATPYMKNTVSIWPVLTLAFISPIGVILSQVGGSFSQQNHRSIQQVTISLVYFFTQVFATLLLSGAFNLGLTGRYSAMLMGSILSTTISTVILLHYGLLRLQFSWEMLKESLRFSIPLLPNSTAGWVTSLSDRILISIYGSLTEAGIYNVGYIIGRGITIFSETIFLVYGPFMYAILKKDLQSAKIRIERFLPYYFLFMCWICLIIMVFAKEIISIVVPKQYSEAIAIIPIVTIAYLVGSQYKPFSYLLSYYKKTMIISVGAILQALLNLGANLIFIPIFGKIAAAWTTLLALTTYSIWLAVWSQKTYPLSINFQRILTPLIGTILIGVLIIQVDTTVINSENMLAHLLFKLSSLTITFVLSWFSGLILPSDKNKIVSFARQKLGAK